MSDIPAGWQPDPRGRHEYRYWDGTQWTDHVSDQGTVSQDPVADTSPATAAAAATEPAATESPATEVQPAAVTPDPEPEPEPVVSEPVLAAEPTPVVIEPEPVAAAEPQPEPAVVTPEPEPVAAASAPPTSSAAPPGGTTRPSTQTTDAKAAAQDVLHAKDPDLATILSATVPGSGHFYMGAGNAVPIGAVLLAVTVLAVVLSYFNFVLFLVGFVLWLAAAVFALMDLRGGPQSLANVSLKPNVVGLLLIVAGVLLIISLFLPYYHLKFTVDVPGFKGSQSGNGSGWEAFGIIDIILLLVGLASIAAGAASLGLGPVTAAELPKQLPMIVAVGGAVAVLLLLFRMFLDPIDTGFGGGLGGGDADIDVGRAFGIWIGLWSAMLIALANLGILRSLSGRDRPAAV